MKKNEEYQMALDRANSIIEKNELREADIMKYRKKQTLLRKLAEHEANGYQRPKHLITDKPEKLRSAVYY
jgi:hypothetical protein